MATRVGQRLLEERSIDHGIVGPARARGRGGRSVTVNLAESPLGWLFGHGHLTERQFAAGERLRADWERGALDPRVTMSWDASPGGRQSGGGPGLDLTLAQLDARRRFQAALDAAGAGLADILWRIVCGGEGMREAERALGWPARAGKLVLTMALDRVADHYRMA